MADVKNPTPSSPSPSDQTPETETPAAISNISPPNETAETVPPRPKKAARSKAALTEAPAPVEMAASIPPEAGTDAEDTLQEEPAGTDLEWIESLEETETEDEEVETWTSFEAQTLAENPEWAKERASTNRVSEARDESSLERVSKLMSRAGLASRRGAEEMIKEGLVSVNGHFITEPGLKADPVNDRIVVDGKPLLPSDKQATVIVFHKPRNVMTTRDDPGKRTTVFDYLPHKFQRLFTVGRLDFDTSGVLLLTDDGELTHLLTHPSRGAEKTYEARVRGTVTQEELAHLRRGPVLEDGPTQPCRARVVAQREKNALVELTIREGRNRQVRRMLDAIGHPVSVLRRTAFAGVELEGLPAGEHRVLLLGEVKALRKLVENKPKKMKLGPTGGKAKAKKKTPPRVSYPKTLPHPSSPAYMTMGSRPARRPAPIKPKPETGTGPSRDGRPAPRTYGGFNAPAGGEEVVRPRRSGFKQSGTDKDFSGPARPRQQSSENKRPVRRPRPDQASPTANRVARRWKTQDEE